MAATFIGISGSIGAGKSSLTQFLCRHFPLTPLPEPNEANPFLADFYRDMSAFALQSQLWFLTHKLALFRQMEQQGVPFIQDRVIYEDAEVFCHNLHAQGNMRTRDYELYQELYRQVRDLFRPPDLLIHLSCPLKVTRTRIRLRGREMEQGLPRGYLQRLETRYREWIDAFDLCPVLHLDTSRINFVDDLVDQSDVLCRIAGLLARDHRRSPTPC